MEQQIAGKAQEREHTQEADSAIADSDAPAPRPLYRFCIEKLHRFIAVYAQLNFVFPSWSTFRSVLTSVDAGAVQTNWGTEKKFSPLRIPSHCFL